MKLKIYAIATIIAALTLTTLPAVGAQEIQSSRVCFTGSGTSVAATPKEWGYSWVANGNGVDLEGNKADDYFLKCVGFSSMSAGKRNVAPWTCNSVYSDGSSILIHGTTSPDRSVKGNIVAGTGRFKGATGTYVGSKQNSTGKAPKGMFAACREKSVFTIELK